MTDDNASKSKQATYVQTGSLAGITWFIGFLFTIGFAHLNWWQSFVSLVIWPYFLGVALR